MYEPIYSYGVQAMVRSFYPIIIRICKISFHIASLEKVGAQAERRKAAQQKQY